MTPSHDGTPKLHLEAGRDQRTRDGRRVTGFEPSTGPLAYEYPWSGLMDGERLSWAADGRFDLRMENHRIDIVGPWIETASDASRTPQASPPAAAPAGDWVLVPREATVAMVGAGYGEITTHIERDGNDLFAVYRAMLAAAPTPPAGHLLGWQWRIGTTWHGPESEGYARSMCEAPYGGEEVRPIYSAPVAPPQRVEVKPLEWHAVIQGRWWISERTIGKSYEINHEVAGSYKLTGFETRFLTLEAAKAAAQADYEQRIRSALVPTSSPQVDRDAVSSVRDDFSASLAVAQSALRALKTGEA